MELLLGMMKNSSWWAKIITIILCSFVLLVCTLALCMILKIDGNTTTDLIISQSIYTIVVFGLTSFMCAAIFSTKPINYLLLDSVSNKTIYLYAAVIFICSLPLINITNLLNEQMVLPDCLKTLEEWMKSMEDESSKLIDQLMEGKGVWHFIVIISVIALAPAICEELFFRGLLQSTLLNHLSNKHVAIWISAFIFSFIHFQFYGFIPRMLLGAIFGYVVYYAKSLYPAIFMHFINNSMSVTAMWLIKNYNSNINIEELDKAGTELDATSICLSIAATVVFILAFKALCKKTKIVTNSQETLL